ncbi:putative bifunctional diguanylate cyclase/phosphodiesterase [Thalassospira tepidiphila]|uniref:Diguanylate cyclase n=2 Tax=Thalassospira tepidiphila TaxID=393657 RepID=A0A853L6U9_9PROT|nr:EAL domain-containing protein [Thalassospira tepidiphila]NJB73750.1 diguanylate cyclase (GGDEF)-like protein [Thalassospira tepidiphila]OAZ12073.1 diguanylate cyclase [Thalassospira tepidiphila MCCC 1A03514]
MSSRLLFIALPLVSLFSLALFIVFGYVSYKVLRDDLNGKVEQTADINARVLATPFWYLDVDNIESALNAMARDRDIVAVQALGADGTEFAHTGVSQSELTDTLRLSRRVYFERNNVRHDVGELVIYFTDARVQDLLFRRIAIDMILFGLLISVVAASLLIANKRSIKEPLNRLLHSIRMTKHGRLRRPVEWNSSDELGLLIREYNEMVALQGQAQEEAQRKQALLEATLHNIGQGICLFDQDLNLMVWNERYIELLNLPRDLVKEGTPLSDILRYNGERGEYGDVSIQALISDRVAIARRREPYRMERTRPNGRVIQVDHNPMPGGGYVATYTDITERKQTEARMRHLAVHDVLTSLPNRTLFLDRLRQALLSARRFQRGVTVLFVDLDRFKDINDHFGHDVGDLMIQEMGQRLSRIIRDSDTAARLGGDEFAIIQTDVQNIEDTIALAQRIIDELCQPFDCRGIRLHSTASVGITLFPEDGENPEQLVKNADMAMYAAKAEGRNNYRFFLPSMHERVKERKTIEEDLRNALEHDQLELYYQPKIDCRTERVVGAEALVRWHHPERGLILPGEFISVAEECGLINRLGAWVLEKACRQTRIWRDSTLSDLRIAVNLSPAQFQDAELVDSVTKIVKETALPHGTLELEITESILMNNPEKAVSTLKELKELGVLIAIDDFGTGYSSLNYLKRFPVTSIKIDRSFVNDIHVDVDDKAIVDAVIGLGHSLNLEVVAEGVEEVEQLVYLQEKGCDFIQGFLFSKPLPASTFESWVNERHGTEQETVSAKS